MLNVYPRKKLDFSFKNIFYGLLFCLNPFLKRKKIINSIENIWPNKNVNVGLSVRTIFDLLLIKKEFKKGSEVIMSGITIPDMVKIVESHNLNVIPIDIKMDSLQVSERAISNAITEKTVMIVIAHLFGTTMEMDPVYKALKKRPDIIIVEDCAQAFNGIQGYSAGNKTDISIFSFGSIKSITALGGAIAFSKDEDLYYQLKQQLDYYNSISNVKFIVKLFKYLFLKLLSIPFIYGAFISISNLFKLDYDKIIISTVRNFRRNDFREAIRLSPPKSQLKFLLYRLQTMSSNHFTKRKEIGDYVSTRLESTKVHGYKNSTHTYWLFPIRAKNREYVVNKLCEVGFDATLTSTQLLAIKPTTPELKNPSECKLYMSQTIYLPIYDSLPKKTLDKLIEILNKLC